MYYTKFVIDAIHFFECDYCTINEDETKIQIDDNKIIKFIIQSDIKQLNMTFYNKGIFPTTNKITIKIEDNYNYKVHIILDKTWINY